VNRLPPARATGYNTIRRRATGVFMPTRIVVLVVSLMVAVPAALFVVAAGDPDQAAPASPPPQVVEKKEKPRPDVEFFEKHVITTIKIEIDAPDLEKLRKDPRVYVPAIVHDLRPDRPAEVHFDVGVHVKGAAGSFRQVDERPALTLNFDKFADDQKFHGLDKLHLNNSVQDPSHLSELIGSSIFRKAGIAAPRVSHARVYLNGRELGFYVLKEGFDRSFLRQFFKDRAGVLFEGQFVEVDGKLPPKVNEEKADPKVFQRLTAAARESDPIKRRALLDEVLATDEFLTFMALEAMTAHWDGYGFNRNNYRVYHEAKTGKLHFLPAGMDQLFQRPDHELFPHGGLVARAMTEHPEDRERFVRRIAELRKTVFNPDALVAELEEASAAMVPMLEEIGPDAVRNHKEQARILRERIVARVREIDRRLNSMPKPLKFDADGIASLGNWGAKQDGGNPKHEEVEREGKPVLRIAANGSPVVASYRSTVLLTKGRYTFEGLCRAIGVTASDGANTGVGLRISGGQRQQRLVGTTGWEACTFEFEVGEGTREVVLVCELRANAGEAMFDVGSLVLRRR
jgi:spore coat protein H